MLLSDITTETTINVFCVCFLVFTFNVATGTAAETNGLPTKITVDGVTYEEVRWGAVTPARVSIFHKTGAATIPLEKLPLELRKRFGYDAKRATDYLAVEAREEQQRRVQEKEVLELKARQEEEKRKQAAEATAKLAAEAAAEAKRIQTQAEVTTLKERAQAAQAYTSHPALLRLEELATLRQLASSGNDRLYIDFQKNGKITPEQS